MQVVLLLTGSIQSAKNMCNSYLTTFSEYEWTWKEDIDKSLGCFMISICPPFPNLQAVFVKQIIDQHTCGNVTPKYFFLLPRSDKLLHSLQQA